MSVFAAFANSILRTRSNRNLVQRSKDKQLYNIRARQNEDMFERTKFNIHVILCSINSHGLLRSCFVQYSDVHLTNQTVYVSASQTLRSTFSTGSEVVVVSPWEVTSASKLEAAKHFIDRAVEVEPTEDLLSCDVLCGMNRKGLIFEAWKGLSRPAYSPCLEVSYWTFPWFLSVK